MRHLLDLADEWTTTNHGYLRCNVLLDKRLRPSSSSLPMQKEGFR